MGRDTYQGSIRLVYDLLLFAAVVLSPWWWLTALLAICGIFMFRNHVEALFASLAFDLLYSSSGSIWSEHSALFVIGLLYLISFPLKSKLLFYRR
jgi:hypothetical protein